MVRKGWFKEPARHSLASMGVKTKKLLKVNKKFPMKMKTLKEAEEEEALKREYAMMGEEHWDDDRYDHDDPDSDASIDRAAREELEEDGAYEFWHDAENAYKEGKEAFEDFISSVDEDKRDMVRKSVESSVEYDRLSDMGWVWDESKKKLVPPKSVKAKKTTHDGFYYKFPKERFYIIRWLKDGGYHLYPQADGKLPKGYPSREAAKRDYRNIDGTEFKLVTGSEASKYPVPKRW